MFGWLAGWLPEFVLVLLYIIYVYVYIVIVSAHVCVGVCMRLHYYQNLVGGRKLGLCIFDEFMTFLFNFKITRDIVT